MTEMEKAQRDLAKSLVRFTKLLIQETAPYVISALEQTADQLEAFANVVSATTPESPELEDSETRPS